MSMVVASALPTHPRRPRVLAGLRGAAYIRTADPDGLYTDAPTELNLGRPYELGAFYARYPGATLFGMFVLFGLGWAGGYATWLWLGRRKR